MAEIKDSEQEIAEMATELTILYNGWVDAAFGKDASSTALELKQLVKDSFREKVELLLEKHLEFFKSIAHEALKS